MRFRFGLFVVMLSAAVVFPQVELVGSQRRDRRPTIVVHNVGALYDAVSRSSNRGAVIQLTPGTYVLSATGPGGTTRPHGGALRLQPGMRLQGSEVRIDHDSDGVPDPVNPALPDAFAVAGTETVIDASGLPFQAAMRIDCAGESTVLPEPIVQLADGVTIADLTVLAGVNAGIGDPAVAVEPGDGLSVELDGVAVRSARSAVVFLNSGCAARQAHSTLTVSGSALRGGLLVANALTGDAINSTSRGPRLDVLVRHTRFYASNNGLIARGGERGTDGARTTVRLTANVFSGNQGNIFAIAGLGNVALPTMGNTLEISSVLDTFSAPTGTFASLFLSAGRRASATTGDAVDNTLEVDLIGTRFVREVATSPAEIQITGGERSSGGLARLLVRQTMVETSAGVPMMGERVVISNDLTIGNGPNAAQLAGTRQAFERTNPLLPPPLDDGFFASPASRIQ